MSIDRNIIGFLDTFYSKVNVAALFERTAPTVSIDDTGNRPKITYKFSTGQCTERFGDWYKEQLAKIFGQENVQCDSNIVNPEYEAERLFAFSIFGRQEDILKKINWYETQGIEKSDKNEMQLMDLLRQHADTLFEGYKVGNVFLSGIFNRCVVVDFEMPFEDGEVAFNVFKRSRNKLSVVDGAFVVSSNDDDKVCQFCIELERMPAIDVLRSASRNGFRLAPVVL